MPRSLCWIVATLLLAPSLAFGGTLRVPGEHKTIQAAIDAARPGDEILVARGTYRERLRLAPGVVLRSEGDDARGTAGLKRAEVTIIDGGGTDGTGAGVQMAEGSTLDGFTITNVGRFDETVWKKHFDSQGEELGDEEGAVNAEGTTPAISIRQVGCLVAHCIVHHNGDVGIGILGKHEAQSAPLVTGNLVYLNLGGGIGTAEGAEPIIRGNTCKENLRAGIGCRKANPLVLENICSHNVRAGIGCREGSRPLLRGNRCVQNRRAGIGIRMEGTSPIVEANECHENEMAGIGCRDGASPVLRGNTCRGNKLAGIGARDGAAPLIVSNECRENEQSGIGLQGNVRATILGNKCLGNRLVAIGVTGESRAMIFGNEFSRAGGVPPLVAVRDTSAATIGENKITGGGVAAILVQGTAKISANEFLGAAEEQGQAVWVWENATADVSENTFSGYKMAVNAAKATVTVNGNLVKAFRGTAIVVKDSAKGAHVFGNTAISTDHAARVVEIQGPAGIVADNVLKVE